MANCLVKLNELFFFIAVTYNLVFVYYSIELYDIQYILKNNYAFCAEKMAIYLNLSHFIKKRRRRGENSPRRLLSNCKLQTPNCKLLASHKLLYPVKRFG